MALTDSKIRAAKTLVKSYKITDAHGLYLLVSTSGSRLWYFRYSFGGKESRLAFGAYPQGDAGGGVAPIVTRYFPAMPLKRLPELRRNLYNYKGRMLTRLALELNLHVFCAQAGYGHNTFKITRPDNPQGLSK
ncbi:DUF4102 domain-containing protein [Sodalis ligni]|nr:DUF4102 domain-containing protein [Sodalis ligni]